MPGIISALSSAVCFIVGMILEHRLLFAAGAGDTASGFGQLMVGLAALFAAIASLLNNHKIGRGIQEVREGNAAAAIAAEHSAAVAQELIPEDGPSLRDVVLKIDKFEQYQHTRNHDILNHLSRTSVAIPILIDVVERLTEVVDRRTEGGSP